MEHLAKAQVSYLRTVSELREKVTKLEAYPVLNLIRRGLSALGEAITDQLNQIDQRTLTVIAMGLYITWPHIAPTMRATIKSTLTAILDKLIYSSRIGRWFSIALFTHPCDEESSFLLSVYGFTRVLERLTTRTRVELTVISLIRGSRTVCVHCDTTVMQFPISGGLSVTVYAGTAVRGTHGWGVWTCRGGEGDERRAPSSGLTYK